jgi:hypothetical protein
MSSLTISRRTKYLCAAILLVCALSVLFWVIPWSNHQEESRASTAAAPKALQVIGIVSDGSSPIANATLCTQGVDHDNRLDRICANTDQQGKYCFELLPGRYSVIASAVDHGSVTSIMTIEKEQTTLDFTLTKQAPTIVGNVRSASGERLEAARITVYQNELPVANATTDAAGVFAAWTPSGSLTIKAEAEGFGASIVQTISPTLDVQVTLFPANVVAGQVLMQGSLQPVPNVRVTAASRPDRIVAPLRDLEVITDERGRFLFKDVTAGTWLLTVSDRNLWGTLISPVTVILGQTISDVTLLVQPAAPVSGMLSIDTKGSPCKSGRIQVIPEAAFSQNSAQANRGNDADSVLHAAFNAEADQDGKVHLDAVPLGTYQLGPACDEHQFASGPLTLTIGSEKTENLRWTFRAGRGITTRVIDETGRPLPQVVVALSPTDQSLSSALLARLQRSGMTDDNGQYRFGGLLPGRYQATARYAAVNGKALASADIALLEGSEPEPLTLTLPGTGIIRVRSRTVGKPLSRLLFFATDSVDSRYEATFKGDGLFVIGPLPRDRYSVFAYDNKNAKLALNNGVPVAIVDATPVDIDFQYTMPDAFLEGRVTDSSGAPMAGTLVRAVSTTLDQNDELYSIIQTQLHGPQALMTDANGRFRIEGLNSRATYDLYVDHPSGLKEIRRQVFTGSFVEVGFPANAAIAGDVADAKGQPILNFEVVVSNLDNGAARSQNFSNPQGRFNLDNLSPGSLQITVYDNTGDLSGDRAVTVDAGRTVNVGRIVLGTTTAQVEADDHTH